MTTTETARAFAARIPAEGVTLDDAHKILTGLGVANRLSGAEMIRVAARLKLTRADMSAGFRLYARG